MKSDFIEFNLASLDAFVARELVTRASTTTIFALQGPLGAGKTTLIKSFLLQLGVTEPVISPTFAYVHVYKLTNGKVIYHFDLYRLESVEQFLNFGFEEYLFADNAISIIEWPEVIYPFLSCLQSAVSVCFVRLEYPEQDDPSAEKRKVYFLDSFT